MVKVFISRPDSTVAWGFRLQGGFEHGEPFTLTNIVPNSPADGKIDSDDMLIEIAGNNATCLTHNDALQLIQRCGNALLLTIQKVGHANPTHSYVHPQVSPHNALPFPSLPAANIPRAPIFNTDIIANATASAKSRRPFVGRHASFEQTTETPNISTILAKILNRPVGPKPFTYLPGGLDSLNIRETVRNRRQRGLRSNSEDIQDFDRMMNRRMIVPPEQMDQHHYEGVNPIQSFSYANQQPTSPKKLIQHDTDAVTHTRSFQMLQGWISDSEKTAPSALPTTNKSTVSPIVLNQKNYIARRSSVGGALSNPSRSFRYLQEQYNNDNTNPTTNITQETKDNYGLRRSSDIHIPSRTFKYLQDQHNTSQQAPVNRSQAVNNRDDLLEIYNKPPASFRQREPEAKRFTGATNPSRSFRFLQMMTEDDATTTTTTASSAKTEQLLNKYDEHNLSRNTNQLDEHPSRSFKYLQELTGQPQSTVKQSENRMDRSSNETNSTDLGESDF